MEKKKGSGCWIAAAAVVIGGIVIAVLIFVGLFRWLRPGGVDIETEQSFAEAEALDLLPESFEDGRLMIREKDWATMEPLKVGEPVSVERYVASSEDNFVTELARSSFQEVAQGAPVNWVLKLEDVRETPEAIVGSFNLPYWIESVDGNLSGSVVQATALFTEQSRDSLLRLRRGEWVRIGGKLDLSGSNPSITEAIVLESE